MSGPAVPTSGRMEGRRHRLPVRVYWEDTDASGIVYHANYLKFMERGRSEMIRLAGVEQQVLLAQSIAFAVRAMSLDFRRPARLDDDLLVETWISEIGGASLVMQQAVIKDGETLVGAEVRVACIDPIGKPRRIPPAIAGRLATLSPNS